MLLWTELAKLRRLTDAEDRPELELDEPPWLDGGERNAPLTVRLPPPLPGRMMRCSSRTLMSSGVREDIVRMWVTQMSESLK